MDDLNSSDQQKIREDWVAALEKEVEELKSRGASASGDELAAGETGMIEVLPTPPLAALLLQWFRSTPYMLDEGLGPLVGCVVMTRRGWNKIPADHQGR